jgi:hypothetical protein
MTKELVGSGVVINSPNSYTPATDFVYVDAAGGNYYIKSESKSDAFTGTLDTGTTPATYTMVLTVTPAQTYAAHGVVPSNSDITWTLTVTDPCLSTTITDQTITGVGTPTLETSVKLGTYGTTASGSPVDFTNFKDALSTAWPDTDGTAADGYLLCGTRTYAISGSTTISGVARPCSGFLWAHKASTAAPTSDEIDSNRLSAKTDDDADVIITNYPNTYHQCTMTISLTDYPLVTHTELITVLIKTCVLTSIAKPTTVWA